MIFPMVASMELRRHSNPSDMHSLVKSKLTQKGVSNIGKMSVLGPFPVTPMYASVLTYEDSTCSSSLLFVGSYLTDTCFSNGSISEKFTCSGTTASSLKYKSYNCSGTPQTATFTSTCASGTKLYSCVSNPMQYGTSDSVVVDGFYQNGDCSGDILGTTGFINNHCVTVGGASYKYNWPSFSLYTTSNNCAGTPTTGIDLQTLGCLLAAGSGGITGLPGGKINHNPAMTTGSYEQWTFVGNGAGSQIVSSMGVFASLLLVVLQLWKH